MATDAEKFILFPLYGLLAVVLFYNVMTAEERTKRRQAALDAENAPFSRPVMPAAYHEDPGYEMQASVTLPSQAFPGEDNYQDISQTVATPYSSPTARLQSLPVKSRARVTIETRVNDRSHCDFSHGFNTGLFAAGPIVKELGVLSEKESKCY